MCCIPRSENYPDRSLHNYACFKTKLGDVMRTEFGQDLYDQLSARLRTELGFQERRTEIRTLSYTSPYRNARESGKTCASLEKVVAMYWRKDTASPSALRDLQSLKQHLCDRVRKN